MRKFIKFSNGKIVTFDRKLPVKMGHLCDLISKHVKFQLLEAYTLRDITEEAMVKYNKNKFKMGMAKKGEEYGPETPLFEAKYYACNTCKELTTNRFKCPSCWSAANANDEGDFLYHVW